MREDAWQRWNRHVERRLAGARPWLVAFWVVMAVIAVSWVVLFVVLGPVRGG